jgi:hypothetical protein
MIKEQALPVFRHFLAGNEFLDYIISAITKNKS